MVKSITITENIENLTLARSLVNRFGQVLLPSGVILKNSHKNLFKTWGIEFVFVEVGEDSETETQIPPEIMLQAEDRLKRRLLFEPETEAEQELFRLGIDRAVMLITNSGGN